MRSEGITWDSSLLGKFLKPVFGVRKLMRKLGIHSSVFSSPYKLIFFLICNGAPHRYKLIFPRGNSKLETRKLETRNSKLETRNSKLEIRNSKFEIRNSKFEIRNSKLETRNSKLPTRPRATPHPNPHNPTRLHATDRKSVV